MRWLMNPSVSSALMTSSPRAALFSGSWCWRERWEKNVICADESGSFILVHGFIEGQLECLTVMTHYNFR